MKRIDLSTIDLNLLVVLNVLLDERHVTRAAKRLHRTQSATSHALARLRDQLGDAILVRVGGEMRPTPRAERLAPEVRRILGAIGRVLADDVVFEPETSDRTFTVVGPDFLAASLPALLTTLREDAPGVGVELAAPSRGLFRDLAEGRYDAAVTPPTGRQEGVDAVPVADLPWAVFARRGHPAIPRWGLDAWLDHPHLRVRTTGGDQGPVEAGLRRLGRTRRAGAVLPHFMLAPPLLAASDLLFTVPYGSLAGVAQRYELVALRCPIPLPPIGLDLAVSTRHAGDPAVRWFRSRVERALRATFGDAPDELQSSPTASERAS